ncbi:MAG: hypothetical protein KJP00_11235, partial [Bacteroidia bacterium]|nr:hypothetical protein [Bacteroidia bacterium]
MRIRLVLLCCILTIFSCQKSDDPVLLHDQEVGLKQLDSPTKKGASKNAADSEIIEAMKLQVAKNSKGVNHKYGAPQWDYAMVMKDDTNADLAFIPCIKPGIDEVSAIIIVYIPNGQSLKMKGYKRDKIIKLKNKKNSKNKALSLELGLILLTSMDTKIFGSTDCDLVNLLNSFYKKGGSKSCSTDVYIIETDWYQYNPTSGEYAHLDSTYDYIWLDVCSNGAVVGDESGGSPSEPNDSDGETNTSTSNLNEEVEEITTNNLREFLQEVCRSPLYGWELNRVAGAAFEEAILNAMEFNRNTSNIE